MQREQQGYAPYDGSPTQRGLRTLGLGHEIDARTPHHEMWCRCGWLEEPPELRLDVCRMRAVREHVEDEGVAQKQPQAPQLIRRDRADGRRGRGGRGDERAQLDIAPIRAGLLPGKIGRIRVRIRGREHVPRRRVDALRPDQPPRTGDVERVLTDLACATLFRRAYPALA